MLQVVCKCSRTWLPSSKWWPISPRDPSFATGGWYIEWTGHEQDSRAGWLHPGVFCMLLGLQAVDMERGGGPWWSKQGQTALSDSQLER